MTDFLSSFGRDLRVAVIGASGGLGGAFVSHLCAQDKVSHIHALSRSGTTFDNAKVTNGRIDLLDESSVEKAAAAINGALDIVIIATGLLHDENMQPEKSLRDLNLQQFQNIFAVNAFGPAMVAKHFTKLLPRDRRSVFAALSARVGSISDNGLGGWYAYRSAKAALNMLIKNTAIEVARKNKEAVIIALHPGTVDTELSAPFQGKVPDGKLFTPQYSAECLLRVINDAGPDKTGQLLAWDGKLIQP